MSQPEPVPRWQIALGNRDEARKARFRSQQVIGAFVERSIANHEAYGKQQTLFVQEEIELHSQGHFPGRVGDGRQSGREIIQGSEVALVTGDGTADRLRPEKDVRSVLAALDRKSPGEINEDFCGSCKRCKTRGERF